ncbi:hypothetical protein Dolphis_64 [Pseudomonas phage Dolphis]|nr:hypothetical protein Dolphis_64 [Pseudomonas phage Dolphis]
MAEHMITKPSDQDLAEAAALQTWLVDNAMPLHPSGGAGLMAWALVALQARQGTSLSADLEAYRASLVAEQSEIAKLAQGRINELTEQLGAARVKLATQDAQIYSMRRELHALVPDGYSNPDAVSIEPIADGTPYDYSTDLAAYFGLSYASWLTLPRVLMEAMPKTWQAAMATLLHQYDEAYPNQPELGTTVRVTEGGKMVPTPEWLLNYRHPDHAMINQVRSKPAKACGACGGCGNACSEVRP